jgi:hypothetical protein
MSMRKLADHIIAVAQKNSLPITNLQLQKVMYFVIKIAKQENLIDLDQLNEIYDEKFQVWAYGPVIKKEYARFKKFASEPIVGDFQASEEYRVFDDFIVELLNVSVFTLVDLSHRVPFWANNKNKIHGFRSEVTYTLDDI